MTRGRPSLKICGTARPDDARLLDAAEIDYCGIVVDAAFSPRSVSLAHAQAIAAASRPKVVILLCEPTAAFCREVIRRIRPFALQLLGAEPPELLAAIRPDAGAEIWKSVHLPRVPAQAEPAAYAEAGADRLLFDACTRQGGRLRFGGTGQVADWTLVREQMRRLPGTPCFVAGGLHAGNVEQAVAATRPHGVDLCSGVEAEAGRRDPVKLAQLLQSWRRARERV